MQANGSDLERTSPHPFDLTCEFITDPPAITLQHPRLSWKLDDPRFGAHQRAYQILAASTLDKLNEDRADLWDTGRVESSQSVLVAYRGVPLRANQRCYWKIRFWDLNNAPSTWSQAAHWDMGLLDADDWQARWIQPPLLEPVDTPDVRQWIEAAAHDSSLSWSLLQEKPEGLTSEEYIRRQFAALKPAPMFRKEFAVAKSVARARLYICGLGLCEVFLNGKKIGDRELDPRQTQYDRWALYVTYDLTESLKAGANTLGVRLGNGWFSEYTAFGNDHHDRTVADVYTRLQEVYLKHDKSSERSEKPDYPFAFGEPGLIAQLEITYADGATDRLVSDRTWQVGTGAILKNTLFVGECYDARYEADHWSETGFADPAWTSVIEVEPLSPELRPMNMPPERAVAVFKPVKLSNPQEGVWVFEMPRIFAGRQRICVDFPAGTALTFKWGSQLTADGLVEDIADGLVTAGGHMLDMYVCKGGGLETWQPTFTYHAGKYIEMRGHPGEPNIDMLEGVVIRSDIARVGEFSCSNDLFNRIQDAVVWTLRSNIHGTINAMSSRERDHWPCQGIFNGPQLMHNLDMRPVWAEAIRDYRGNVNDEGLPYDITPSNRKFGPMTYTTTAVVILPWHYYCFYGDTAVLTDNYDLMKQCLDASLVFAIRPGSHLLFGLGDHCDPENEQKKVPDGYCGMSHHTPSTLVSSALYYRACIIFAQIADGLNRSADAQAYRRRAEKVRDDIITEYYDADKKTYGSQCGDSMALLDGLYPPADKAALLASLKDDIATRDHHLNTGFFGTPAMLEVLCENDEHQIAFDMMNQTTYPSYGYYIDQLGAREIWEYWKTDFYGQAPFIGRMQMEKAGAWNWVYRNIAGIQTDAQQPGYKHFFLKPSLYRQLNQASATYDSNYGLIESNFVVDGTTFTWSVTVPPNTFATVFVPGKGVTVHDQQGAFLDDTSAVEQIETSEDRTTLKLPSGRYRITSQLTDD